MASSLHSFKINEEYTQDFLETSKIVVRNVTKETYNKQKHEYLWIIDNYDKIKFGILYQSHQIVIGEDRYYLCFQRIKMNTRSESNPTKSDVKIVMKLIPNAKGNIILNFAVMDYSKKIHHCIKYTEGYYAVYEEPHLTVNARFQVICSITIDEDIPIYIHQPINLKNHLSLSEDLDGLLMGGDYSDIKIVVGRNDFKAHRCILASRSSVFAKMLEVDMMEKNQGKIVIEDCPANIFYDFLLYLYSGKVKISSVDSAFKLIELGEKYCTKQLKSEAGSYLSCSLTTGNVIDVYKLSDLYSMPELKTAAVEFISLNLLEVIKHPDWEAIRATDSMLDSLLPIVAKRNEENMQLLSQDYRPPYNAADSEKFIDLERDLWSNRDGCAFGLCGKSSYNSSIFADLAKEVLESG